MDIECTAKNLDTEQYIKGKEKERHEAKLIKNDQVEGTGISMEAKTAQNTAQNKIKKYSH